MKLYHIVAYAKANRVIGKNGKLPWHFSEDLKHFKSLTMGSTLIMGRKTFEAIGKPLPGRENFVLSRSLSPSPSPLPLQGGEGKGEGVKPAPKFFSSIEGALKAARTEKVFIIGGADVFRQTMDLVNGIYATEIEGAHEGDVFYPEIPAYFKEKSRETLRENPHLELIFYENTKKK